MLFELKTVTVQYDNEVPALHGITIEIKSGSTFIIYGPTGAGKTTLLRLLYGGLVPTSGTVYFKNQEIVDLSKKQKRLLKQISGIIFQEPRLVSNLNCFDNVMIPLILNGNSKVKSTTRCLEVLAELGISYLRTKYPEELSLGERKLISTARAVVHNPEIIIADEPTDNLDEKSKSLILTILKKSVDRGTTLVMTTNDPYASAFFPDATAKHLINGKLKNENTPLILNRKTKKKIEKNME